MLPFIRIFAFGLAIAFCLAACSDDNSSSSNSSSQSDGSSSQSDSTATSPPSHDDRAQYQDFWNSAVGNLAMSYACVNFAAKAAAGGDTVSASRIMEYAQKFADNAKNETLNPPGDWNNDEIGARLFSASSELSDAMDKMRSYLDDSKPSEAADAQDSAQSATADVQAATEAARNSYVSMGGKASDIESMQSKVDSTVTALNTLMGSGSGGDNQ